ncbi:Hsp20 family protein (plasmid) [Arthrobacter sp. FW306-05-C]|uniref:Hsp20/alpha crystallin family protein n=1 Tax=unclassified Arthrobacter TaxID=235627 RepID=UPI001EEFE1CE|nr:MULTISPECIES: HSP20 family small heat-shock protein [unclassified Arthrobacter]UKA69078.1 Hsp20 family protein [Arthrobacter sp. FW306-05-C]UKA70913.1 Hsp20 family protein [Arthrobacter sp. FW306-06-A]
MLMMSDPFRQFDRLTQQVLGTAARPAAMALDAWRDGKEFVVAVDLPGVDTGSLDVKVEQNVLTIRAERKDNLGEGAELLAAERPRGVFSRQLILGEALDTGKVKAAYDSGVLTVRIPVAEKAQPRKIEVTSGAGAQQQISA